jgi:hypothetical protein
VHLDHVQIAIPAGGEDHARGFFGDLLGLTEIPKPEEMRGRGGCWFQLGDQQLHIGVDPDFRPARKAHVAVTVANLDALRTRLSKAGFKIIKEVPLGERERFFSSDPFGNRMEFVQR